MSTLTNFNPGTKVNWIFGECVIESTSDGCYIIRSDFGLWAKVSLEMLEKYASKFDHRLFKIQLPTFLAIDNFYTDPNEIREIALFQDYETNLKSYKGKRTNSRFLFPNVKERFEEILGVKITSWLNQPANGVFQITNFNDPLVYHCDSQSRAAAIYLTPDAPPTAGTSFWKDRTHGCRRSPLHPTEVKRLGSIENANDVGCQIFSEYNLVHPDNWELVDRIGNVFNRLVMWDAKIIHSASSYDSFTDIDRSDKSRLVQLFFFDIELNSP